ncbi:MAG: replicative DNA helicase [Okeania sp. SIO3B5]|uniref:replicative DNA helicase n=1 Tax=Okeania sp. SIO3B5 TaxID=2607811 RepID=UPI001400C824|nr:replicative DNA helicase [Okeania sp. SIO3B5]NEO51644.1 replicative DNA helicase [Okeania sp. SIO3B5]
MSSDRLPPQNIEAEEAILGGILLDPEAVSRVTELLRPEFFAIEAHQILYKAMWQLYNQGKPTDLMTVTSWLTDNNKLEKIGGQVKIVQLLERTVSAVNIDQYAVLVIDKYIRRKLIQAGNEIFDLGFQTATELKTILDQAEQKIFALTQDKPQQDLVPISETLINTFQEIEDRNEGIALPGLACGFYDLDAMTGGFQRSDLIIVAGRPSMGKCAAYDTLVLQKDGSLITLAEVYQRQEIELLTLGKNWKFQITKPSAFIDDGIKPVFRVTTKSGRFVETTITHPFLTVDGWKPLAKLQVGEKIAVPRLLDVFGDESIPENQFASLIDSDNFCLFPIVFKLEKSQLALFIRYLFSQDGWIKICETGAVCLGYSVESEKLVRQVQHLLLRFGIIGVIEKVFKEFRIQNSEFRSCFCNRDLWHLTITDALSQKNFIVDIGGFDSKKFDFDPSWLNLTTKNNFWDELVSLMENFTESKSRSVNNRSFKGNSPKNSENLTTADTVSGKNFLVDMGSLPSEILDFDSDRFDLDKPDNFWVEKLENTEVFWNKVLVVMEKFTESKSENWNLLTKKNSLVKNLKDWEIFVNEIVCVMEKFAESRWFSPHRKNSIRQTDKIFGHLTTSETLSVKSYVTNISSSPSENWDLLTKKNSLVENLKDWEIFVNEIVCVMEKFAESRWFSPHRKNSIRQTDKIFGHLTTSETFGGKNLGADMRNFPSINLDFPSSILNLVIPDSFWVKQLKNTEIFGNEITSVTEKFVAYRWFSPQSRNGTRQTDKNFRNLTTSETLSMKSGVANIGSSLLEDLDFDSDRFDLAEPENSWSQQLENTAIFWNKLVSLIENFAESKNQSLQSRTVKGKSDKNSENLTTTDTLYRKNILIDMRNLPSENLDLYCDRLNLVKPQNSCTEHLEIRDIFWNKLVYLIENFAESKNQSLQSRNVKGKSDKNSENLTTTDTLYRKNILIDMRNLPSENLDLYCDRLNLVKPQNSCTEQLESSDIFWSELVSLVEKFAESKNQSLQSRSVKRRSPKNSENLTTTDTICGRNILADIRNFPSENQDFYSDRLNLVRPQNSWSEQLESRDIFWNKLVNLIEKFAESKNQSLKSRSVKRKSDKNADSLTTTDALHKKNILIDTRNLPSENLDFHSDRLNLVRPQNSCTKHLENSDIFWDEIVSIEPVGEKQVYDLTIPETHNFVANDICLHNTSFAVNIGHSIAANLKLPVAIFSLEMSKEQLVLRLLASEARIESNRLRSGRISQNEWEPLTSAIGTLAEMPIFIDDTPNITVNEIRSKVRQLQSEQGGALGLILLDYLQLMEGSNTDNRVLELARITRSLKGLARELSVPIIALSQLSRSVESRTNKRPMMSDLRESGCLTGDTLICLADGKQIPISCLVGKSNFSVLALNENTGKFESAMVSRVFSTGVKPILLLQTSSGKLIRATANHPFFSMGGWKQLNTLNIGDSLAILNQKMLKYSILYCGQLLSQVDFGPKNGGNLGSVVKCREWEKPTQIDVNWDEIVEIRPDGEAEVFDLTVPGLHNFVANEIVVHNSIEQDADLVIMLYRDEYYSPDTPDQGIAEVIITKHRNGPTGTVKLLFDPQFTKFRNLAIRGNREQGTGNR